MPWWHGKRKKHPAESELDSEIRFHLAELMEQGIAAGLTPGEARRRAILEFGGSEQLKEELRDVYRIATLDRPERDREQTSVGIVLVRGHRHHAAVVSVSGS